MMRRHFLSCAQSIVGHDIFYSYNHHIILQMDREDFKRARMCTAEEIAEISADAWSKVLSGSYKSAAPVKSPPIALKCATPPTAIRIAEFETIRFSNRESHQSFSAARINFHASEPKEDSSDADSVEALLPSPLPPAERLKPSDFFEKFVQRTPDQCAAELAAPQRSEAWLNARKLSITASQFGAAAGESQYQSPDDLVIDKLWNTFRGNAATEWGTQHEPHAKESFCDWFEQYAKDNDLHDVKFSEENLIKFAEEPWMAVSPDGIVTYTTKDGRNCADLVEFKCPAYLRNTAGHPYAKYPLNTPSYYKCQTQGIMGYINAHKSKWKFQRCWFVVWQPHQTWITLQPYDEAYYTSMHEKLENWYFKKLLPAFTHKHNNLLVFGETQPQEPIELK